MAADCIHIGEDEEGTSIIIKCKELDTLILNGVACDGHLTKNDGGVLIGYCRE